MKLKLDTNTVSIKTVDITQFHTIITKRIKCAYCNSNNTYKTDHYEVTHGMASVCCRDCKREWLSNKDGVATVIDEYDIYIQKRNTKRKDLKYKPRELLSPSETLDYYIQACCSSSNSFNSELYLDLVSDDS